MKTTLEAILLALISLTAGCPDVAFAKQPTPVTFGFAAVQCERTRNVVCVADEDYPSSHCVDDTTAAVDAINEAAHRTVLVFSGMVSQQGARAAMNAGYIMVTGMDFGSDNPSLQGYTQSGAVIKGDKACIIGPIVVMIARALAKGDDVKLRSGVLIHEMLHALGARHRMVSTTEVRYMSRMDASIQHTTGLEGLLSGGDKFTIYVTYGDWD